MDIDLIDWLEDLVNSQREDPDVKALATKLYKQWQEGIVVSPRQVRTLRHMRQKIDLCARLEQDGTCTWLRKYAATEGVLLPKPGESIRCHRLTTGLFEGCQGFKELKGDLL